MYYTEKNVRDTQDTVKKVEKLNSLDLYRRKLQVISFQLSFCLSKTQEILILLKINIRTALGIKEDRQMQLHRVS